MSQDSLTYKDIMGFFTSGAFWVTFIIGALSLGAAVLSISF